MSLISSFWWRMLHYFLSCQDLEIKFAVKYLRIQIQDRLHWFSFWKMILKLRFSDLIPSCVIQLSVVLCFNKPSCPQLNTLVFHVRFQNKIPVTHEYWKHHAALSEVCPLLGLFTALQRSFRMWFWLWLKKKNKERNKTKNQATKENQTNKKPNQNPVLLEKTCSY